MTMVDVNDDTFEKISALLDGELGDFETRQLLRQIDQLEPEQREQIYAKWQRMQIASDLLQNDASQRGLAYASSDGFVASVSAAIAADTGADDGSVHAEEDATASADIQYINQAATEPDAAVAAQTSSAAGTHGVAKAPAPVWSKMAVAASVALAVIVGVQQFQISGQNDRLLASQQTESLQDDAVSSPVVGEPEQAVLLAEIEAAGTMQEQLQAQRRLIDYLQARQLRPAAADPFARVANFEEQSEVVSGQR